MKQEFLVERNGLKRWNRAPDGYVRLDAGERVRGGDVQRISDELYCEYPANGLLVGKYRGAGGVWLRRADLAQRVQAAACT